MGGPLSVAKPPNRSVRPPSAVRLESAFKAPGLASNCANGIAVASELTVVELANGFGVFENGNEVENGLVGLLEVVLKVKLLPPLVLLLLLLLLLFVIVMAVVECCVLLLLLLLLFALLAFVFKLFKLLLLL